MTTKEKVIRESIERIEIRQKEISKIIDARPASQIAAIYEEFQKMLDTHKTVEERTSESFIKKVNSLHKQEKYWLSMAKKQENTLPLIIEQVELDLEMTDLKNELFRMEMTDRANQKNSISQK